ncbi:MAG: FtsW/RodA/SpoVE family cell cycle protein [Clostridiales bacterium]|nr:FtsW/RodA/SpoVE family cell cycle protein [Clostridiales bacterium]
MKKVIDTVGKYLLESDMLLLVLCVVSTVFGIILIDSATRYEGHTNHVTIQTAALILGVILYVLFSLIDLDMIADKSKILYVLSVLLISTLFIWGVSGNTGNRAWLRFGSIGIQPSEIVKIPYTIIMGKMITTARERRTLNAPLTLLKIVAAFGFLFAFIIISSQDLGSALVYLFIFIVMLFIGGLDLKWIALGVILTLAMMPVAWEFFLSEGQKARILAPYDPSVDPTGLSVMWQANQSKQAISGGRFFGQGLYNGVMTQSGAVPRQHTDFIFSVAGEELGFAGCFLVILLLLLIIIRVVYVGIKSNSTLGMLVCTGFAAMLTFQMLENIGMCLGLTPVIGLTLPFFSYGGSSIVTVFSAMGIVSGIKMRPKPARFRSY